MTGLDFSSRVKNDVERIKKSDELAERDKELLIDFKRDMKLNDVSSSYLHKLLVNLRQMGERMNHGFEGAEKDDIKDVIEWIKDRDISVVTKQHYKKVLKRFYKWLNDGEFPEKVDWINTTLKKKNQKLPNDMLKVGDIEKLRGAAGNPRDRALISLLWETGVRIGEVMDLTVGDLKEGKHGKKALVNGKTGSRMVYLRSSVPDINDWLRNHPKTDDPDAPLWCKVEGKGAGKETVGYRYILKALKRAADGAGVDKPVNPHHFRHSRATDLATKFTEAEMCQWFGWVQGSDRPADYVHLSGRDIESKYDQLHGLKEKKDGSEESDVSVQECPRCGNLNDPEAKFCQKCGLALDEKTAMEAEKKEAIGEMVMEKVEEMGEEGTLDELIKGAVEEKVKEILARQ